MSPLETSWRGRHVVVGIEDDVCTVREGDGDGEEVDVYKEAKTFNCG